VRCVLLDLPVMLELKRHDQLFAQLISNYGNKAKCELRGIGDTAPQKLGEKHGSRKHPSTPPRAREPTSAKLE
jgi:hypothetical protein